MINETSKKCLPIRLDRTFDALIIGAGIAGLAAAHKLVSAGADTIILEANDYAGGRIRTIRYEDVYAEAGALVVTDEEHETLDLLRNLDRESLIELGLHGAEIFFGKRIVHLSRIDAGIGNLKDIASLFRMLRAGLSDGGRTLPLPGPGLYLAYRRALRAIREGSEKIEFPYQPYLHEEADKLSFGQFLDRFHPKLKPFFDLQLKVTAGALSDEISLYWGLVTFHWNVQGKFFFLRGGTSVLPEAIASVLGERLQLGVKVQSVIQTPSAAEVSFACSCGSTHTIRARAVVMATPPRIVLDLVKELEPRKRTALAAVRFGAYIPVQLYCRRRFWEKHIRTGYLNSAGLVFADLVDGTREQSGESGVLIAFIGGPEATRLIDAPESEILAEVRRDLKIIFPDCDSEIIEARVFQWNEAIPYLDPETGHRLEELRRPQGQIYFCGDYTQGAGINDAVVSGQLAAQQILEARNVAETNFPVAG